MTRAKLWPYVVLIFLLAASIAIPGAPLEWVITAFLLIAFIAGVLLGRAT